MSRNASFIRKISYIAAIALLLAPIAALSGPATVDTDLTDGRDDSNAGGRLSQLRTEYNLAQARLGEIDPASETMKLASLGLRGVAANILWVQANHYKKVEDWDKLEMTVNQIIRLQPNFVEVWDFQAHNLSYNVSVEFDDYHMRYEWVKKGIKFLIEGTHYNRDEPGLLSQLGWFMGQKVGRADEQVQFRNLYAVDDDFHDLLRKNGINLDEATNGVQKLDPLTGKSRLAIDNWLTAKLWYDKAVNAATVSGKPIRGRTPLLFYSGAPMSIINGSAALQKDGIFGDKAQQQWERADAEWTAYGNRDLPTSAGFNINLNALEAVEKRIAENLKKLDADCPGAKEKILAAKRAALSDAARAAMDKAPEQRTEAEAMLAYESTAALEVRPADYLAHAPREKGPDVRRTIDQLQEDQGIAHQINLNRRIVNFAYWRTRCKAELRADTQRAHANVYQADRQKLKADEWEDAKKKYEEAWKLYAVVFAEHPALMENAEAQDLVDSVIKYNGLLGQMDESFPADFPLEALLKQHEKGKQLLNQVKVLQGSEKTDKPAGAPKPGDAVNPGEAAKPGDSTKPADATKPPDATKPAETTPKSDEKPAIDASKAGAPAPAAKSGEPKT